MLLLCGFLLWKPACEMGLVWPHSYRTPIRLTCCCIWSSETPLGLTTWLETLFLRNWHTGHQEHTCRGKHQHSPYATWLCSVGSPLLAEAGLAAIRSQPRASIFWIFQFVSLARGCLWLVSILKIWYLVLKIPKSECKVFGKYKIFFKKRKSEITLNPTPRIVMLPLKIHFCLYFPIFFSIYNLKKIGFLLYWGLLSFFL